MSSIKKALRKQKKSGRKEDLDDTPRSFKRLMEMQQKIMQRESRNSDTPRKSRTPKSSSPSGTSPLKLASKVEPKSVPTEAPKLERRSGESMREFSVRVDQAIPLPKARGTDNRKTIRNAKKHKIKAENLRAEYRQRWEAKKRRAEEQDMDNDEIEDDGEDIWASVNAKAKQPKFGETADRPPELPPMNVKSSIPKSVGSLARREMLEEERARFIELYRKLRGTVLKLPDMK